MTASKRPLVRLEVIRAFREERRTDGVAEVMLRTSYANATVADIVAACGIARNTFYDNFANKEAAFIALLERAGEELLELVAMSFDGNEDSEACFSGVITEILGWVAEKPGAAKALLVEAPAIGERGFRIQRDLLVAAASRLADSGFADGGTLSAELFVGGVFSILRELVREENASEAAALGADLLCLYRPLSAAG